MEKEHTIEKKMIVVRMTAKFIFTQVILLVDSHFGQVFFY
jgi:hypothetical protein